MEPDCDFLKVTTFTQTDIGIIAGALPWLFDLQIKENLEMEKKRKRDDIT